MKSIKKDPLFLLIQSLSRAEKRQFRLYVGRIKSNSKANFITLFNLLEKIENYDERIILSKTTIKKQQFSNTKAHLYKQIMVSLRLNLTHKDTRVQIRELLDFATILYNKGLYKQSLKTLYKAKNISLKNGETALVHQVIELEKVIESQHITRSMFDRADELAIEAKNISIQGVLESKFSNLSLQLYSWFLKYGYVKDDKDLQTVQNYYNNKIPQYNFKTLSFSGKMFLYQANLWLGFITQNFVICYRYSQKLINLFEVQPQMKQLHNVFYLKSYNYTLESLLYLQKVKKFENTLLQLEKITFEKDFTINENTLLLSNLYLYLNKINLCYLKGNFKKGIVLTPEILQFIKKNHLKMDNHHILLLYYKIACLYFGTEDYQNTLLYLKKIIYQKNIKIREDLLCYARVLYLVTHYEMGKDAHIEKLIKSTYKFLIKINNLYKVQQKIIDFLKKLTNIYPSELKVAFVKLHRELKVFENHPYEKRAFLYLDILSWLESHTKKISVASVIQRKIKS